MTMSAIASRLRPGLPARTAPVRTAEDREFLLAHLEILETPASPKAVLLLQVIAVTLLGALLWSIIAQIDIFAVATGRVQFNGRSKVVQPFDAGRVREILVDNGASVQAGAPLVVLDPTEAEADLQAKDFQVAALELEVLRRDAEIRAIRENHRDAALTLPETAGRALRARETANFRAEISQYMSTREGLLSQVDEKTASQQRFAASLAARERLLAVLRERADMRETLASRSAGTRAAVLDALQLVEQTVADIAYDRGQLAEAEAAIVSTTRRLQQLRDETLAQQTQKVSEAEQKLDGARQDAIKARDRLTRTTLRAPIDGTVQQLAVTSVGQVVTTGQPLLVIAPSGGAIEVEASVVNRDAAFVTAGQRATVKVDAFPFTRYGTLEGVVTRVSRDAVDDREANGGADNVALATGQGLGRVSGTARTQNLVYQATIRLDHPFIRSDGADVPLAPGMTTVVEVQTGRRRVIDYVLSPVRETMWSAMHER